MSAALTALARQVTAGRCSVAVVPVASGDVSDLFEDERDAIRTAVPARQREFAAGRMAARLAMGVTLPVPPAPDRAPLWPPGWTGSITHAGPWAVGAVAQGQGLVGIDLEPDEDLPEDILSTVLTPSEQRRVRTLRQARLIFAIKEAVYKAQFPLTRRVFGFGMFEIDLTQHTFAATFQQDLGPFRQGEAIRGLHGAADGFVMAGVAT